MKVLKQIAYIYLGILILALVFLFLAFPVMLQDYYNDDRFLWLLFFNIPVFIGFILTPFDMTQPPHTRPKR